MLGGADPMAQPGQPVVPAPLVIQRRVGSFFGLFDKALIEHPLDRPVQRPRTHPHRSAAQLGDVAHDGVAVLLAVRQRHDDVHDRRRQRQELLDLVTSNHDPTMTGLDLLCQVSS